MTCVGHIHNTVVTICVYYSGHIKKKKNLIRPVAMLPFSAPPPPHQGIQIGAIHVACYVRLKVLAIIFEGDEIMSCI